MSYELVIVPSDVPREYKISCIECGGELSKIKDLKNDTQKNFDCTDYESELKMCRSCAMAHLVLDDAFVDFKEPVIIGWT